MTYIVHTQRGEAGIHFFYQVVAPRQEDAYDALCVHGAIDSDEAHVETFPVLEQGRSHELLAIIKTR